MPLFKRGERVFSPSSSPIFTHPEFLIRTVHRHSIICLGTAKAQGCLSKRRVASLWFTHGACGPVEEIDRDPGIGQLYNLGSLVPVGAEVRKYLSTLSTRTQLFFYSRFMGPLLHQIPLKKMKMVMYNLFILLRIICGFSFMRASRCHIHRCTVGSIYPTPSNRNLMKKEIPNTFSNSYWSRDFS